MPRTLRPSIMLLLAASLAMPGAAQDPQPSQRQLVKRSDGKVASSPFPAPEADDHTFVTDDARLLDTGCIFRNSGPIRFNIEVTRAVGELNADGTLRNAAQMVRDGILSSHATLIMPVYDVDSSAIIDPPFQPEIDIVSFNGREIGRLSGENNTWKLNSFQIPIEQVKFPRRGGNGARPTAAVNEVRIDIDTGNAALGSLTWCTDVDWGTGSFGAMSPILLIHGNNSDGGFFERQGFTAGLRAKNLLFDNSINMVTDTIVAHGKDLDSLIPRLVRSFGVDSVHLVAHSKGGLDAREYLAQHQPQHDEEFKVLSLTTLSTPHNGSVLADLLVTRKAEEKKADLVQFSGFPSFSGVLSKLTPLDTGTSNLTTGFVADFNRKNFPGLAGSNVVLNTVAADADTNGNQQIDRTPDEYEALRIENEDLRDLDDSGATRGLGRRAVDIPYQILRQTAAVQVSTREVTVTLPVVGTVVLLRIATLSSVPNPTPLGNDVLVTLPSGLGEGSIASLTRRSQTFTGANGRNHSSVADRAVAESVIPWMIEAEKSLGDLK